MLFRSHSVLKSPPCIACITSTTHRDDSTRPTAIRNSRPNDVRYASVSRQEAKEEDFTPFVTTVASPPTPTTSTDSHPSLLFPSTFTTPLTPASKRTTNNPIKRPKTPRPDPILSNYNTRFEQPQPIPNDTQYRPSSPPTPELNQNNNPDNQRLNELLLQNLRMSINEEILKEISKSLRNKRASGGDDSSSSSSSSSGSSSALPNNNYPNQGDDPSDPSSDSSISSCDSGSKSKKSKKRTKKLKTRSKAAKKHKYYTLLFNKLCKAAKNHRLGNMSKLGSNPVQNRIFFTEWIDTLKDVFNTHHRTMTILDDFPHIPKVSSIVNKVMQDF